MIEVVQAFDRAPITELQTDDQTALERKITTAHQLFADRGQWLEPYQRLKARRTNKFILNDHS